ncbi:MAG TPA: hypothetical protein VG146_20425 [Verrucomicrobiae bacterium]|nr:hypothetical protein [Verrucomicrobiae bacterium]
MLALLEQGQECRGQQEGQSVASEAAAEAQAQAGVPSRYNIRLGGGGINLSAGAQGIYVDNVYLTHENARDDFILAPEVNAGAFFPIGQLNTLSVNLGLEYYHYFKNSDLNSSTPTINPNSDLEFHIYTGDFRITLSEVFSYQELPFFETGGQFFNVYDTGRFARFDNRAGASATWDLHDLVVDAGYHHEDLLSNGSAFNFIDRHSEIFNADAFLSVMPRASVGMEAAGSWNQFDNVRYNDHWRAGLGPALKLKLTDYINVKVGAGYQRVQYDSDLDSQYGLGGFNTFYAYVNLDQTINKFFSHSLVVSHDNEVGINAANLEGTHVTYALTWNATQALRVAPYLGYTHYTESYNSGVPSLYHETFDYVSGGIGAAYTLTQNWRLGLSYDYRLKDSDIVAYGFSQDRVTLEATYQF